MRRPHVLAVAVALLLMMSASACSSAPIGVAPPTYTATAVPTAAGVREVVVYASDLQQSALPNSTFMATLPRPGGSTSDSLTSATN